MNFHPVNHADDALCLADGPMAKLEMVPPDMAEIFMFSKNKPSGRRQRNLPALKVLLAPVIRHHRFLFALIQKSHSETLDNGRHQKTSGTLKDHPGAGI